MSTKDKILKALDCALDDIGEGRLIDILLDAYKGKQRRIEELEGENERERQDLHAARDKIMYEMDQMRQNPLYGAGGDYFFVCDGRKYHVRVQGKVDMCERRGTVDYAAQQIGPGEFLSLVTK